MLHPFLPFFSKAALNELLVQERKKKKLEIQEEINKQKQLNMTTK